MKICLAQTRPVKGDFNSNLKQHVTLIQQAVDNQADMIVFPELSLTGYELDLAQNLATTQADTRLDVLQTLSDAHNITIAVGCPTRNSQQLHISLIIFQPNQARLTYSKQHLAPPEKAYFNAGKRSMILDLHDTRIAPAICYEISNATHVGKAKQQHANLYIASILSTEEWITGDLETLANIAKDHKMSVLMANYVGISGGYHCVGQSCVYNQKGTLLGQLDDSNEGLLYYDTQSQLITQIIVH